MNVCDYGLAAMRTMKWYPWPEPRWFEDGYRHGEVRPAYGETSPVCSGVFYIWSVLECSPAAKNGKRVPKIICAAHLEHLRPDFVWLRGPWRTPRMHGAIGPEDPRYENFFLEIVEARFARS